MFTAPGSVAVSRNVINSPITFGLKPEQVKELTEAAARGATGPLTSAIVDLSNRLGVTQGAMRTILAPVGQADVPAERLIEKLAEVFEQTRKAANAIAALQPDNPVAQFSCLA
jgi:hypothetical protein